MSYTLKSRWVSYRRTALPFLFSLTCSQVGLSICCQDDKLNRETSRSRISVKRWSSSWSNLPALCHTALFLILHVWGWVTAPHLILSFPVFIMLSFYLFLMYRGFRASRTNHSQPTVDLAGHVAGSSPKWSMNIDVDRIRTTSITASSETTCFKIPLPENLTINWSRVLPASTVGIISIWGW